MVMIVKKDSNCDYEEGMVEEGVEETENRGEN